MDVVAIIAEIFRGKSAGDVRKTLERRKADLAAAQKEYDCLREKSRAAVARGAKTPDDFSAISNAAARVEFEQEAVSDLERAIAEADAAECKREQDAARADLAAAVQERATALAILYALGTEVSRLGRAIDSGVKATNLPSDCLARVEEMAPGSALRTATAAARLDATGLREEARVLSTQADADPAAIERYRREAEGMVHTLLGPAIVARMRQHAAAIQEAERAAVRKRAAEDEHRREADAAVVRWMASTTEIADDGVYNLVATAIYRFSERGALDLITGHLIHVKNAYESKARLDGRALRPMRNAALLARAVGLERL